MSHATCEDFVQTDVADFHNSRVYLVKSPVEHLAVVNSTQKYLLERKPEFMKTVGPVKRLPLMAVSSAHQTSGRGKCDRKWFSDPHSQCLALSLMFPIPVRKLPKAARITQILGLSCIESIGSLVLGDCKSRICMKWPNDIMIGEGKVGGILAELEAYSDDFYLMIIGVGINVSVDPVLLHAGVSHPHWPPESIKSALGVDVDYFELRDKIIESFCTHLSEYMFREVFPHAALSDVLFGCGKRVRFAAGPDEIIFGVIEGIAPDGGLELRG